MEPPVASGEVPDVLGDAIGLRVQYPFDRHQRLVARRIRTPHFPAVKSLDTFDSLAIPLVNEVLVMELARCEYVQRHENVIAVGNSGTG